MKSETGTEADRRPARQRFRLGRFPFLIRPSSFLFLLAVNSCRCDLSASPPPFLHLRDTPLGYHGAEADFTNLTELRLGWFGPTNLNDPLTGDLWWAANLAIEEANEQPSAPTPHSSFVLRPSSFSSLPIRLIPRWAVDPWGTGVSQLTRMVYEEQPLALIGSVDSASTHLAEQVVAKANLPLVSPIATDQSITLAGVSWMFSCAPSDAAIARVLVDDILAALKDSGSATNAKPRLALLACTDHESRLTAREVLKECARRGHLPDFRFDVPPGAHVLAEPLGALDTARPAAVLIIASAEDAARWVQAVRERSSPGAGACLIFGSHSMGRRRFRELAGAAAEELRFPLLFVPDAADTNAARFIERFRRERQHPPDYTAAFTYDATRLLIAAGRRAGPNRARIREALQQLSPWAGVAGPIHFDGTGQNTRTNIRMGTIRKGAILPLSDPPPEPERNDGHSAAKPHLQRPTELNRRGSKSPARQSRNQRSADSLVREARGCGRKRADKAVRAPEKSSQDATTWGHSTAEKNPPLPALLSLSLGG